MSYHVVWRSRASHVHVLEVEAMRDARQLANSLQRQQGIAEVIDKSTGSLVFRPPWLQIARPSRRLSPRR